MDAHAAHAALLTNVQRRAAYGLLMASVAPGRYDENPAASQGLSSRQLALIRALNRSLDSLSRITTSAWTPADLAAALDAADAVAPFVTWKDLIDTVHRCALNARPPVSKSPAHGNDSATVSRATDLAASGAALTAVGPVRPDPREELEALKESCCSKLATFVAFGSSASQAIDSERARLRRIFKRERLNTRKQAAAAAVAARDRQRLQQRQQRHPPDTSSVATHHQPQSERETSSSHSVVRQPHAQPQGPTHEQAGMGLMQCTADSS
jgi:hypothetical protein